MAPLRVASIRHESKMVITTSGWINFLLLVKFEARPFVVNGNETSRIWIRLVVGCPGGTCVFCVFVDTLSPVLSVGVRGEGPQKWLKYYKCWLSDSNVLKICCNDLTVDVFCESNALNFC